MFYLLLVIEVYSLGILLESKLFLNPQEQRSPQRSLFHFGFGQKIYFPLFSPKEDLYLGLVTLRLKDCSVKMELLVKIVRE